MAVKTIKHDGKVFELIVDASEERDHSAQIIELFFGRKKGNVMKLLIIRGWGWQTAGTCEITIYDTFTFISSEWKDIVRFADGGDSCDL